LKIRHFSAERHSRRQKFVSLMYQCRNLTIEIAQCHSQFVSLPPQCRKLTLYLDQFDAEFVSLDNSWLCRCLKELSHFSTKLPSLFSTVTRVGSCVGSQFWNPCRGRTDTTIPPTKNAGNLEVEVPT
jgi:hypothetical protein